jgi:hypothetical protein
MKWINKYGPIIWKIPGTEPTIITNSIGNRAWYVDGVSHREDGPAIIHTNGSQFWYYKGKFMGDDLTLKQFQSYIKLRAFW